MRSGTVNKGFDSRRKERDSSISSRACLPTVPTRRKPECGLSDISSEAAGLTRPAAKPLVVGAKGLDEANAHQSLRLACSREAKEEERNPMLSPHDQFHDILRSGRKQSAKEAATIRRCSPAALHSTNCRFPPSSQRSRPARRPIRLCETERAGSGRPTSADSGCGARRSTRVG